MAFAQEVTVEVATDPLSLAISAVAVVLAGASAIATYRQGKAIRDIETREHEWQGVDRTSAHVRVTRMSETRPSTFAKPGASVTNYRQLDWIRLLNSGRSEARNITWDMTDVAGNDLSRIYEHSVPVARMLEVLHPGEHFDILLAFSMSDPPHAQFDVQWDDEMGPHRTTRLINL
jgi:hypothetical protein